MHNQRKISTFFKINFLLRYINTTSIGGIIEDISQTYEGFSAKTLICIFLLIGIFIAVFGSIYPTISLGFITSIVFLGIVISLREVLVEWFTGDGNFLAKFEIIKGFGEIIDKRKKHIGVVAIILSIVIATIVVKKIQMISIIGFIVFSIFIYNEMSSKEALFGFSLASYNMFIRLLIFIVFIYLCYKYVFMKIPKIIFIAIFSVSGSFFVVYSIEYLKNEGVVTTFKDWQKFKLFDNKISLKDIPSGVIFYLVLVILSIFCQILGPRIMKRIRKK